MMRASTLKGKSSGTLVGRLISSSAARRTGAAAPRPSTKTPLRSRGSTQPSSASSASACSAVITLTPSSAASARLDGSLLPGG